MNKRRWLALFLAAFSGLFLWSAYPPWDETGNAWFALAPLLCVLRGATPQRGFRLGLVSGLAFWLPALGWLCELRNNGGPLVLVLLGYAGLSLYCALYSGVFGAIVAAAWRELEPAPQSRAAARLLREGGMAVLAALLWSGLELIRSTFLTGFAWNHLGVTQTSSLAILQLASLGGVYLVSFLLLLVNGTLANVAWRVWGSMRGRRSPRWHLDLLLSLGLVVASFIWGAGEMRRWHVRMAAAPELVVATIQPNAPSIFDRTDDTMEVVSERLSDWTARMAIFEPDLVVWPETSLPGTIPYDPETMEFAFDNARRARSPLLAGAVETERRPGRRPLVANASWLFEPDGRVSARYRKQHLVPFGEFIPLDRWFPWLEKLSPIGYSCTPGTESALMAVPLRRAAAGGGEPPPDAVISPLICFEDTVSHLSRKAVRAGATVLVNQSNDAWFGGSSEPRQHHLQAILRAVETRTPLVRCSNAGESAYIDPTGRSGESADCSSIPVVPRQADWPIPVYTRLGDLVFGWPCVAVVLGAVGRWFLFRRRSGRLVGTLALQGEADRESEPCGSGGAGGSSRLTSFLICLSGIVFFAGGTAVAEPVAVLYGEASVQAGDRAYSRAMARNLARWLEGAGLEAEIYPDSRAGEILGVAGRKVVHLVNFLNPPEPVLQAVDRHLARQGRLIVYNSASAGLAARMGLEVGPYRRAPEFNVWTHFRFAEGAPANLPVVVRQAPGAFQEMRPLSGSAARPIAWWYDRRGRRTDRAAWFAHPHGYWMVSALLADGDGRSRRELVAGLTGACDAGLWKVAAGNLRGRIAGEFGGRSPEAVLTKLRKQAVARKSQGALETLREAEGLLERIGQDGRAGQHAAAVVKLRHLRDLFTEALAMQQPAWRESRRIVWDHEGFGLYPGDWERTCATLQRYGITDILLLVASPGAAHADIPGLAPTALRRDYGDQLKAATAAAERYNLQVHAWVAALKPMLASRAGVEQLRGRGLLLGEPGGAANPWLNPLEEGTREWLKETVRYLVRNYRIAGIHLDYIRYPDLQTGLDGAMRTAFERDSGLKAGRWPDDVLPDGRLHRDFTRWRKGSIDRLVSDVRQSMDSRWRRRSPVLSAAVYGRYPLCVASVGQDWMTWLQEGTLDWAIPMNYTSDMAAYRSWLGDQTVHRKLRGRIMSGIGVTAAECTLDARQVMQQIQLARQAGCGGYVFFDLDATLEREILPYLRLGVQGEKDEADNTQ